ncbi:lysin B [Gordonia phage Pleakley]|uniref:Lysin B n=1 Tax=Gordonia phage Pleakley TaxID=2283246 RepID=A0A345M6E3_9CAUD|nr:lysin B [Gordonia phage Pleakley]AXH66064.1 lysin B [Gordonia phage Pleakley]
MMDDITVALRNLDRPVGHYPVPYYASIAPAGGTKMFHESYHDGWRRATLADASGQPTIWVGYSLGALILGDLMAAGELANCIGMILFADPLRPAGVCSNKGPSPREYGCAGNRAIKTSVPVYQFSAPDDPISSLSRGNGFRLLAQAVTGMPQPLDPGYFDINALIGAVRRYLGTPPIAGIPAKVSRHVVYRTEKAPGDSRTYTKIGADLAVDLVNNYRRNR